MRKPHKWSDVMISWIEGKEVEFRTSTSGEWTLATPPTRLWPERYEYRIKPHQYQDVIDAYLRGETVQYYVKTEWNSGWMDCPRGRNSDMFDSGHEYRILPDKYQYLRNAIAEGKTIQYKGQGGQGWIDIYPCHPVEIEFNDSIKYRIKPEPKPDIRVKLWVNTTNNINLTFVFDGETKAFKTVEYHND